MQLDYLEDVNVNGVIGYRYMVNKKLLDNGTTDPDTWCNCGGDCLPQGVINTTQCLRNVPLYTSYPHYLDADPYYRRQVNGLQPDPDIHSFYVTVEPVGTNRAEQTRCRRCQTPCVCLEGTERQNRAPLRVAMR
jgi:hypothetical protein